MTQDLEQLRARVEALRKKNTDIGFRQCSQYLDGFNTALDLLWPCVAALKEIDNDAELESGISLEPLANIDTELKKVGL